MLHYLYADEVDPEQHDAEALLAAAQTYELRRLAEIAECALERQVGPRTLMRLLHVGEAHGAPRLQTACLR